MPAATINVVRSNTILYCQLWDETVRFYRDGFGFAVSYQNEWFVELVVADGVCLSVADERRTSIRSAQGQGITLTWQVPNLDAARESLLRRGLSPGAVRKHPWGARVCYLRDPEGHRVELWEPLQ